MSHKVLRCMSTLAGVIGLVLGVANQGLAQQMSFAVYNDVTASGNGITVYNYGSADDNSWGCSHWSYSTTARLYSPTGRSSSRSSSGLSANTSLAFADDSGNWTAVTQGTYRCSCINGNMAAYGGGIGFYAGRFFGRYWNYGTLCPNGKNGYLADDCSHRCMIAMACSSAQAPYLWDVGVALDVGGYGACHHNFQGSNSRGLCQGP